MEVYMGTVQAFGFNFAPSGWATCQGQLVSIASNTALFALLGTYYGGNGVQTFGLPDLRGRTIVGQGTNSGQSYDMGERGGAAQVTLMQAQMPMHTHIATGATGSVSVSAPAYEDTGNSPTPGPNTVLAQAASGTPYSTEQPSTTMAAGTGTISGLMVQIAPAGGSMPVNIESPYLAMNYCIAVLGYFPPRQ